MNQKPKVLKFNRHASHLALKKSMASVETPQFEEEDIKSRKNTFWMKKAVGPQGIQNMPPNFNRPLVQGRRALSSKIKTCEQSSAQNKQEISTFHEYNSKFNIILKHQKELIEESRIMFHERSTKIAGYQKLFDSLTKVLKTVCNNHFLDSLPSLRQLLSNHINQSAIVFRKIAGECHTLKNQKLPRPSQQFHELKEEYDCLSKDHEILLNQNKILKILNSECSNSDTTDQQDSQSLAERRIPRINYERVYLESCGNENEKLKTNTMHVLCDKVMKVILQKDLLSGPQDYQNIFVNSSILASLDSLPNSMPALRRLLQNGKQNKYKQEQETGLFQLCLIDLLHQKIDIHTVFQIRNIFHKELKFVRKNGKRKEKKTVSLQQLMILLEKIDFLVDSRQEDEWKRKIKASLLKRTRLDSTGAFIPELYIEMMKELEMIDEVYEKSPGSTFYEMANMSAVKNRRLVNCLNLIENKMKTPQTDSQSFENKFSALGKLEIPYTDGILCLFYYFEELLSKVQREVHYLNRKKKEFSTKNLLAEYIKNNFIPKFSSLYSLKEPEIQTIEGYYQKLGTVSNTLSSGEIRSRQCFDAIMNLIVKTEILKFLAKEQTNQESLAWLKRL